MGRVKILIWFFLFLVGGAAFAQPELEEQQDADFENTHEGLVEK